MRTVLLALSLLLCAALGFDPSTYPKENMRILRDEYTMYFKLDFKTETIQFGLVVNTLGWIGFGIGETNSGSMPGSDIAVLSYAGNKPVLTDHFALDFVYPEIDACQHWQLVSHTVQGGTTMFEISRKFNTGDTQDRDIHAGFHMIVFAWGLDNQASLVYHESRRGESGIEFYPDPNEPVFPNDPATLIHENHITEFSVPTRTTTYACMAHAIPLARSDPDHHVIRVDPVMDPRTVGIAHHMLVHACWDSGPLSHARRFLEEPQQCLSPIGNPVSGCATLLYGWAMGIEEVIMPEEAGGRMGWGNKDAFTHIVMEMHYDNPSGIRGLSDSSGYRIYYTPKLRKYDAGTMTLGDPYISFPSIPPRQANYPLEATCPSECTKKFSSEIHLFTTSHHMHQSGKMMWTTHYRDDVYLGTLARTEFFDFALQHVIYINVTVKPGDRLNIHCSFNTIDRARTTGFGYASFNEMCMDFVGYYPRQLFRGDDFAYCGYFGYIRPAVSLCGSNQALIYGGSILPVRNPSHSDLEETFPISFGNAPSSCKA